MNEECKKHGEITYLEEIEIIYISFDQVDVLVQERCNRCNKVVGSIYTISYTVM